MEKYLVAELEAVKEQKKIRVHLDKRAIMLAYYNDNVYAIDDQCPHLKASLTQGTLDENIITCKSHKAQFDITTGKVVDKAKLLFIKMPTKSAKTYETLIEDEKVYILK